MKITDKKIAELANRTPQVINAMKKRYPKQYELLKLGAERLLHQQNGIDDEYFIFEDKHYYFYKTIRDKSPLAISFYKKDLKLGCMSAELENNEDAIRELIKLEYHTRR